MEPATRIISASRRTDLPGYHAEACAERLRRLRKPVHSVFFWTRYPAALCDDGPLAELVRHAIENPFVLLTVTGLGGSELEPRVPSTSRVLAQLDALIEALRGDPRRLIWRFDPVIKGRMSLESFEALAEVFGALGVRTCIISFPAQLSLKGPLDGQYARFGIQRWGRREKLDFALCLAAAAARHGLTLQACVQQRLVDDAGGAVEPAACISAELAEALHPRRLPLELPKDPQQRRHCHCAVSHDIGRYDDRCGSGCAYCYSSAGGPSTPPTS
jgi:hypothetical protein